MKTESAGSFRTAALALMAGLLAAGSSGAADGGRSSPSSVLSRVDARLGSEGVSFPERLQNHQETGDDKTLAPYFYVAGGDPETERLPLKETSAQVQIAGVIARVKVRQLFENAGQKPIEAVYVFPASTRAAVHGMRMKIGERTVEAKIEKKQAAREQYEQAKAQGKRASLLEQQRPNVFTMNVANLMPRDRIEVELDYSELLIPEDAVYEFVYPTVVGPRYGGGADPVKDRWIANPYLHEGEKEPYRFDIQAHVETGIPIKELSSPSHIVDVSYLSQSSADVRLRQQGGGNKDFVLRYRLAGDRVETGLLLFPGEKEGFFALMMEPPQRPTSAQIPPREYIFLLDVSGSMHGFPLDTAKVLVKNLLSQLRPIDLFNVALFSGTSFVMDPEGSLQATAANVQRATEIIDRQRGGGGTELMGGLQASYAIPKRERGVSRSVVVITDGYVGVEAQAFRFVREHLGEANLFAFGIGSSVNRGLIEGMARAGLGEPFVVLRPEAAREQAEKLRAYIESPVLTDISVSFPGFDAYEVAPMKVPDLMARRPLVLFGKYRGGTGGKVVVNGTTGEGKFSQALEVSSAAAKAENAPLRWLWARKWVEILEDEMHLAAAKEIEDSITDLGLSYSLLTSFTSFVAIDSEVVNKSGQSQTVSQPLPMPEGVSDLAVGGTGMPAKSYGLLGVFKGLAAPASPPPTGGPMPAAEGAARSGAAEPLPPREFALKRKAADSPAKEEKARAQARPRVLRVKAEHLADSAALLAQVEKGLKEVACIGGRATLRLLLSVDVAGKVVKVEVLGSSDTGLAECLRGKLLGLSAAARPSGASTGTLELTISIE